MKHSEIIEQVKLFNDRWCRGRKPTLLQYIDMARVFGLTLEWTFPVKPRDMVAGDIGVSDHG